LLIEALGAEQRRLQAFGPSRALPALSNDAE
jgi:hypothetical protein